MDQNKKIVLLVVAMLVVAGFAYWGVKHGWFKNLGYRTAPNNIKDLPVSQVPPDMPQDIILPKDAKVVHSYTAATPDGQSQSTLIYQTSESPGVLNQEYFTYFAKNNWGIQIAPGSVNASSTQMATLDKQPLVAVQQGKTLSIKVSQNTGGGEQWIVSMTLLMAPKK